MTLRQLLLTPLMKSADLMAGTDGLDSEISWCAPEIALQFDNWIMPGILLLYTGEDENLSCKECVDAILKKSRLSGVLLFGEKGAASIEEQDAAYFEQLNLPLIKMSKAEKPLRFSKRFAAVAANYFKVEYRREEWLKEFCYSENFPGGEITAESFGYNTEANYACMCVTLRKLKNPDIMRIERHYNLARDILSHELSIEKIPLLSFFDRNALFVFIPSLKTEGNTIQHNRILHSAKRVRDKLTECKWSFSVGTTAESLLDFCKSYHNSQQTAKIISALSVHEKVSFYNDWYLHMLLLKEPKILLQTQRDVSLSPILDRPDLVETLTAYLAFGENLKVTSEKLYIHVNTLKYRINHIGELLHCDLKDPNVRFRLRMAVTINRYLRGGEAQAC